jgi:hypothetical protein
MADSNYDTKANEEHAPKANSISNNPTSRGNVGYSNSNPYEHSLQSRENAGGSVSNNQTGNSEATGANSKTSDFKQAAEPQELRNSESQPQNNFSYSPGKDGKRGGLGGALKGKLGRKAALLAVGSIGGGASLFIVAFFLLIPLKIESIVSDLESHFFSSADSATEKESDNMFSGYMKSLLPALRSCGDKTTAVVNKSCNPNFGNGTNPVRALYKGWRQANLETKLSKDYGIEFQFDRGANGRRGQWYLKTPTTTGEGDPLGDGPSIESNLDTEFQEASRADMRSAIKDETSWYNVMMRYKVGRLLEEKYGIKRCIVFCGVQDAFAQKKTDAKYAAKLFLIDRVITPRNAALGNVMSCFLLANDNCDGKSATTACTESTCDELGGEEETAVEASTAEAVGQVTSGFGSETAANLVGYISDMRAAGGFENYAINKIATKLTNQEVDQNTLDDVPGIGELQILNQGFGVINILKSAPQKIQRYSYIVNAGAAVSLFTMYETYADEIHTGHVTATEVGSFTQALGPGDQCDAAIEGKCPSQPVNGTAEAENTPLYSSLIEGDSSPVKSKTYKCNDNQPVPSGKMVCPEEDLSAKSQTASSVKKALDKTGLSGLASAYEATPAPGIFNAINSISSFFIGPLVSGAEAAVNLFAPGLISSATHAAGKIFEALANDIIPSPISADESGGRTFDMMSAGADVSGNDFAHTGLGGQQISSTMAASITQQQEDDAQQQFQDQPLFARLFSTNTPDSLVSKVAMDVPFGLSSSLQSSFASFLDPLNSLSSSFGSLFSSPTSAAATATSDPFGVTQYGYPDNKIPSNPEAYWDAHCSDNAAQAYQNDQTYKNTGGGSGWNGQTSTDPDNGQQVNTTTNPCLLIKSTVGSAGATSDSSLLTSDDLADVDGGSSTTPTTPTTPTVSGSAQQLAQQILSNKNIDLSYNSSVSEDVQDAADGKPGTAGAMTSAALLKLIVTIGQSHKVAITAIQSDGQGHCNNTPKSGCPSDPHYNGDAVDFGSLDGVLITGRNAPAITIMKQAFTLLPSGSGFGQNECGSQYSSSSELPNGDVTFDDTCNHLHVQVPAGTP